MLLVIFDICFFIYITLRSIYISEFKLSLSLLSKLYYLLNQIPNKLQQWLKIKIMLITYIWLSKCKLVVNHKPHSSSKMSTNLMILQIALMILMNYKNLWLQPSKRVMLSKKFLLPSTSQSQSMSKDYRLSMILSVIS